MLDDAFQSGTDLALQDRALRPSAPPAPQAAKFNAWRTGSAVPRGTAAGAAESAGFLSDVLGAFGQAMAATDARSGMFAAETPEQRQQGDAAARRVREQGVDFSSEAGDIFRGVARSYRPDPVTAHAAESLVFDASRFLTKAVGYSLPAGPVLGALGTGADEASMVADDLKAQGVDLATRTKVGAVQGTGAAVGVLVPVAGKTVLQTAALVAAGGPGTFIAQQAATRAILQAADYSKIGDQYDPFDPVGLAVSTVVPAAFGAYGLRRARTRPDRPVGEADVATAPPDASTVTPEQVDAARVALASEERRAGILAEPNDIAGQARHDDAIALAEEQMARGEPVRVPEVVDGARADVVLADFAARVRTGLEEARAEIDALDIDGLRRANDVAARLASQVEGASPADVPRRLLVEADRLLKSADQQTPEASATTAAAADMLFQRADDLASLTRSVADAVDTVREVMQPKPAEAQRSPESQAMQARVDQVRAARPDLEVQLDGMDAPMRLSDFLDRVKQEADADVADSSLYQLAAECAITL